MNTLVPLGKSDLQVSRLCFGGNVFGWTIDEPTSFAVLDAFAAGGGNFVDTADVYSAWAPGHQGGESETILGRWMKARGNRASIVLATKVGGEMGHGGKGLRVNAITRAVEDSLRRLQTDRIDLYQAHIDDSDAPLEETLTAFDTLVKAGKVRALGASNYTAARLRQALEISAARGLARYACLQPRYNAVSREFEQELAPLCQAESVAVIPYSSLASGFLTGKYRQGRPLPDSQRASGVHSRYMNEAGFAVLERVEALARAHHATPGQIALAWLLAQPTVTAPIASATSVAQTEEMLGALQLNLSVDSLDRPEG